MTEKQHEVLVINCPYTDMGSTHVARIHQKSNAFQRSSSIVVLRMSLKIFIHGLCTVCACKLSKFSVTEPNTKEVHGFGVWTDTILND